ncbi:hypothetical protein Pta02_41750 [Planobispora takensis]|uniref:Uncharacterized protein n=2 Tax=Planobispora takensis TaxID=1367882 RepID=A0A8J3WWS7_9ACTN|nr:hypothetical protein Pta02_41750 [Planobispora takensis]
MSAGVNRNVTRLVISIVSAVALSGVAGAGVAVAQAADSQPVLQYGDDTQPNSVPTPTPTPSPTQFGTPWGQG